MAIKGLDMLHYAIITQENDETTVYSEVKPFGPAVALNLQPSINRGNLRADDKVLFSDSSKGPTTVSVNTAYLDEEVEADILGKTLDDHGGVTDAATDDPPYIAIGGRAKDARGGYQYFWIYRVKLAPAEENKETEQETPTYQTPNLSGEGLPRINDGLEKYKLWDQSSKVTDPSIFEHWFDEVIDKNWVPEV